MKAVRSNHAPVSRLSLVAAVTAVLTAGMQQQRHPSMFVAGLAQQRTASETKGQFAGVFASPSRKLTISPEVFVSNQESNPTAFLLQASALNSMSTMLRTKAKANAIFVDGPVASLRTVCMEQEEARGMFPGPLPVVYCGSSDTSDGAVDIGESIEKLAAMLERAADAGACGMIVSCKSVTSADDLASAGLSDRSKVVFDAGLQPVPEITISESTAQSWTEDDVTGVVEKVVELLGEDPVSILFTVEPSEPSDVSSDSVGAAGEEPSAPTSVALPTIPADIAKRIPIIGSVRAEPTAEALNAETAKFKESGFSGVVMRKECVPGYGVKTDANGLPVTQNLEYVGNFWSACISELKSVRSKSFGFRAKNQMEKHVATQWANLQADVIDSGALGDMQDSFTPDLDEDKGEYKGFG